MLHTQGAEVATMRDLIENIAKSLVDKPEDVSVKETQGEKTTIIELRVAQEDLGPDRFEVAVHDALHRTLSPYRHERRRLDVAVRRRHDAAPRGAVGVGDAKGKRHLKSVFGNRVIWLSGN